MIRPVIRDTIALFVLFLVVCLFLLPLFYPTSQLVVTPDFVRSDSLHSSIALKLLIKESFAHHAILPLWSRYLQQGFPLIAEGQIGIFFIPNLISFIFFPAPVAYNMLLVSTLWIFGSGIYAWLRRAGVSRSVSFFGAVSGSFSGPMIVHFTHIALIQGFSIMPWILLATERLAYRQTRINLIIFSLALSQQLFTGSPQPMVITLCFSLPYYVYLTQKIQHKFLPLLSMITAIALGLLIACAQLLPSVEFLSQITISNAQISQNRLSYNYPISHLVTLINPYLLGNVRNGTYFAQTIAEKSIFWEATGYVGVLPIILLFLWLFQRSLKIVYRVKIRLFGIAMFVALLLAIGSKSPVYLIYSIWPFTLFNVPARFIWILSLSIIYLAALSLESLTRQASTKKIFYIIVGCSILIQLTDSFTIWKDYHLISPTAQWISKPEIAQFLNPTDTVYSIGFSNLYKNSFQKGWKNPQSYIFLSNSLQPNITALWGVKTFSVVSGRNLRRHQYATQLLSDEISMSTQSAHLTDFGNKLLSIYGITKIILPNPLEDKARSPSIVLKNDKKDASSIYVYPTSADPIGYYIAESAKKAKTIQEAKAAFQNSDFIPGHSVVLESDPTQPLRPQNSATVSARIVSDTETVYTVSNIVSDSYLVIAQSYYPGWNAYIDNKKYSVIPANIYQSAVPVSKGNHLIRVVYEPTSVKRGMVLSIIGMSIVFILAVFPWTFRKRRTHPSAG